MAAVRCAVQLAQRYPQPHEMVNWIATEDRFALYPERPRPFEEVALRARQHPLFGPWIAFKICDMLDRLGLQPVTFSLGDAMYDSPTKAAIVLFTQRTGETMSDQGAMVRWSVDLLLHEFENFMAPPRQERPIGYQEIETILCKWKSHLSGHYPLYNDIREIHEGVLPWTPYSATARAFLTHLPPLPGTTTQA